MLSTVLIGNSNTVVQNGLMVTPRGYANKYDVRAGAPRARASALAGRSPPGSTAGWKTCLPTMLRATASKPGPAPPPAGGIHPTPAETRWKPQRKMPRKMAEA